MSTFSQAVAPIRAMAAQARSNFGPLATLAKGLSRDIIASSGMGMRAGIGALGGGAIGAGYSAWDDRATSRSIVKGGLVGAMYGGLAGGALSLGRGVRANWGMVKGAGRISGSMAADVGRAGRTAWQAGALGGGMAGLRPAISSAYGAGRTAWQAGALGGGIGARIGAATRAAYGAGRGYF